MVFGKEWKLIKEESFLSEEELGVERKLQSEMLPKRNRLNKKEIAFLKEKQHEVLQGNFFGLIFTPNSEKKFGLIISAKIAKKAVEINPDWLKEFASLLPQLSATGTEPLTK